MQTNGPRDPADALTSEILVTSPNSDVFHAPHDDGGSLCGVQHGHTRQLQHAPLRTEPCGHCYTQRVVEEYNGAYRLNGSESP
jgi:hypothetical protein